MFDDLGIYDKISGYNVVRKVEVYQKLGMISHFGRPAFKNIVPSYLTIAATYWQERPLRNQQCQVTYLGVISLVVRPGRGASRLSRALFLYLLQFHPLQCPCLQHMHPSTYRTIPRPGLCLYVSCGAISGYSSSGSKHAYRDLSVMRQVYQCSKRSVGPESDPRTKILETVFFNNEKLAASPLPS